MSKNIKGSINIFIPSNKKTTKNKCATVINWLTLILFFETNTWKCLYLDTTATY